MFFFFEQKTAYEMRISDWSSDVCSSELLGDAPDQDMAMGMARVEMIHRHPVQGRTQILLHLRHQVAGKIAQMIEGRTILGRDDQAELVAVVHPKLGKGPGLGVIGEGSATRGAGKECVKSCKSRLLAIHKK